MNWMLLTSADVAATLKHAAASTNHSEDTDAHILK